MPIKEEHPPAAAKRDGTQPVAKHVGGVNDQLGGVDPEVDENLMRLAGGP